MRSIPSVNTFLEHQAIAPYEALVGRVALRHAIDAELDRVRASREAAPLELLVERIVERIESDAASDLRAVINATGTLLHTNLGRAPLAQHAFVHGWEIARGYSNLEFDLGAGERGSRYDRAASILREVTGAQDAVVVNNCAAAILLILDTFARGAEVIVARNQLIEVGGGFRLPDVLARSGASLVEVGATNKVYLADYQRALSPRTALLFRSHQSNFSMDGFIADVAASELAALAKRAGVIVAEDLGTGALIDLREYGLPHERTVLEAVADGVHLVAFSGDKLLGGPQAGIIVGTSAAIARLRANPLIRALRVDKVTLALLASTLALYRSKETREQIPFYRMLATPTETLADRARAVSADIPNARVVESQAFIGGGSLPKVRVPSIGIALATPHPQSLAARLRGWRTPIVTRVESDVVLLDMRTIAPEDDRELTAALHSFLV